MEYSALITIYSCKKMNLGEGHPKENESCSNRQQNNYRIPNYKKRATAPLLTRLLMKKFCNNYYDFLPLVLSKQFFIDNGIRIQEKRPFY